MILYCAEHIVCRLNSCVCTVGLHDEYIAGFSNASSLSLLRITVDDVLSRAQ